MKAVVIGAGFSGLSCASFLAKYGWDVTIVEKHSQAGGRARQFQAAGFTFDMGPSWYWMPDIFERYFQKLGFSRDALYPLTRLDPSYKVFWPDASGDVPADYSHFRSWVETLETGAGERLDRFLKEAQFKYEAGMRKLVFKPGKSPLEYADIDFLKGLLKLDVFTSMKKHVARYFRDARLRMLMEFPVLFLGALPQDTPALYSLMNYADICGGTWYPANGMHSIVSAMEKVARNLRVNIRYSEEVRSISFAKNNGEYLITSSGQGEFEHRFDVVIASADYHFVESNLLPRHLQSYNKSYWDARVMAPSCLLYFIGLNKRLHNAVHHNLFFDTDFQKHADEIYKKPAWPSDPMFYVSITSVTDDTVAPPGSENLFFLVPIASGLQDDSEQRRDQYFDQIIERFETRIGESVRDYIVYKKTYGPTDFVNDYHAFRGNAYGLANTLSQTGIFKPKMKSRKVKNLYYTGQLTVPGPGVPPSLISGEIVAKEVNEQFGS